MIINIKNTKMVQPSQETPKRRVWLSNLDIIISRAYTPNIYFYRAKGLLGFFDPNLVKEALSRALVPYYPVAGRLRREANGQRIEIDCNEEGVLLVEAETTSSLDDFGDFSPTMEHKKLVPRVDCSGEISSFPLLLLQLTYFKCGGVSLSVSMHHLFADGFSRIGFVNAWADAARGLDPATPFLDRTLLRSRDPPHPKFPHVEYEPSPTLLTPLLTNAAAATTNTTTTSTFNITKDQINSLKANATENYTSFEILSGHIWRCVCIARGLSCTQKVKLYIAVDARSRLEPNLPPTYFGNAVLCVGPMATAGDLVSMPASYAANKIHESIVRVDDDYIRSSLDYIKVNLDKDVFVRGSGLRSRSCPNLAITSWAKLPVYGADFGWGRPTYMGPVWVNDEGYCCLAPRATNDGGLSVIITLFADHMRLFETYFYRF